VHDHNIGFAFKNGVYVKILKVPSQKEIYAFVKDKISPDLGSLADCICDNPLWF
jgi:hypothetical protein